MHSLRRVESQGPQQPPELKILTIGLASGLPLGVDRLSISVLSDEHSSRANIFYGLNILRNELMSIRDHGFETSARFLRRSFALACATLFLVTSSIKAGTVLQFSQVNAGDNVTASESGGATTLSTAGNADGGGTSIPVAVSNFDGAPFPPGIPVFETFVGVTSTGAATSSSGTISQLFSGQIVFSEGLPPGINPPILLVATFANAVFSASANAAALMVSAPNLTLTSELATFPPITGMAIGFSGITPALGITDGSLANFTMAQNAGTFSAAVPEPSALCLGSLAVVIGSVTAYGRKRMKIEPAN
jgi:hypothetical protein